MTEAPAPTPERAATTPAAKAPGFKFEFLKDGSISHSLLWTEKSGFTQMLIIFVLQFGFPLLGLSLHHMGEWSNLMMTVVAGAGTANGFWYPSAQMNGIERATKGTGTMDSKQVNRDTLWSVLPVVPVIISVVLTGVMWGLMANQILNAPEDALVRELMLMSPAMLGYNLLVLWAVKVDLGNGGSIIGEMSQMAGRLMRFEH